MTVVEDNVRDFAVPVHHEAPHVISKAAGSRSRLEIVGRLVCFFGPAIHPIAVSKDWHLARIENVIQVQVVQFAVARFRMVTVQVHPAIESVAAGISADEGVLAAPPGQFAIAPNRSVQRRRPLWIREAGMFFCVGAQPDFVHVPMTAAQDFHPKRIVLAEKSERECLAIMIVAVDQKAQAELFEIVNALRLFRGRLGARERGQEHAGQNRDNGNNDQ